MKKEFDLKVLKNADKGTIEKLAERYPASSNKDKEKIYRMAMRKSANSTNTAHTDIVKGVDLYRRPKWYRHAAVAASFLIVVAGITGTFYAVCNFRIPDESDTSYYHQIEETTSSTTSEFDITTKEGIYQKMQNSIYYFNRVSGEYIESTDNSTSSLIVDFETDLESARSYSHSSKIKLDNGENKVIKEIELCSYCDGTQIYSTDPVTQKTKISGYASRRSELPVTNGAQATYADVTNLRYPCNSLMPRLGVLELIDKSEYWEISGTETYLGRACTTIAGTINVEYSTENNILSYWLCVDNQTGIVLKSVMSDMSGEIQRVMLMRNIAFDDDVEVRDLDQYTRSGNLSEYDPGESPAAVAAVYSFLGKTGFIKFEEVFASVNPDFDKENILNVYDTDLKTVIDEFSFNIDTLEGEIIE